MNTDEVAIEHFAVSIPTGDVVLKGDLSRRRSLRAR